MAVFRIEKTRDYTVMANFHLRDTELSLKAKGLLSLMLSLPEDWDYTTKGLARICRDGVDSICSTVRELEDHGYIIRERVRNEKGQLTTVEYTILEQPVKGEPGTARPGQEKPKRENPVLGKPGQENPTQLNTNKSNTDLSSTEGSNPIPSNPLGSQAADGDGTDGMMADREAYKQLVMENIEYAYLIQDLSLDREHIDELVALIVDTVCSSRRMIRIAGDLLTGDSLNPATGMATQLP